jgi:hypothetical protein
MATYLELYDIGSNGNVPLLQKIAVACVIKANDIRQESSGTNLANRQKWAREVLADPSSKARQMLWAILGQNAAATVAQINAATDATILSAVASAIDLVAV